MSVQSRKVLAEATPEAFETICCSGTQQSIRIVNFSFCGFNWSCLWYRLLLFILLICRCSKLSLRSNLYFLTSVWSLLGIYNVVVSSISLFISCVITLRYNSTGKNNFRQCPKSPIFTTCYNSSMILKIRRTSTSSCAYSAGICSPFNKKHSQGTSYKGECLETARSPKSLAIKILTINIASVDS